MSEDTKFVEKFTDEKEKKPVTFADHHEELKQLLHSIETDVLKADKGVKSAKVSIRKVLRLLKAKSAEFVKFSLGKVD